MSLSFSVYLSPSLGLFSICPSLSLLVSPARTPTRRGQRAFDDKGRDFVQRTHHNDGVSAYEHMIRRMSAVGCPRCTQPTTAARHWLGFFLSLYIDRYAQILRECLASLGLVRGIPEGEFHAMISTLRDRAKQAARGFLSTEVRCCRFADCLSGE